VIALSLSLAACLGWGVADFLGGLKSRHLPTLTVLAFSNIFGVALIGLIVYLRAIPLPRNPALLWAIAGGLAGIIAMTLLYRGLAIGAMSVVAPISATGVILPMLLGFANGDQLSRLQWLGSGLALIGAVLAAREPGQQQAGQRLAKGVSLAAGAALATGVFFLVMDQASEVDPYWAAFLMRLSYGVFLIPLLLLARPSLKVGHLHLPAFIFMGSVDALAGFAFALATTIGVLSLVAVVGSLYPAVTVLLSAVLLRERIHKVQGLGVIVALVGVVFISAG